MTHRTLEIRPQPAAWGRPLPPPERGLSPKAGLLYRSPACECELLTHTRKRRAGMEVRPWDERVTLHLGKGQCTRNPRYLRCKASEGQVTLGRGTYLPLRKLCCSEGLVSLLKRTEAHTRQTFLLPDPRRPLPGGGGRSQGDRLRVTTYQASPGLIRARSPGKAKDTLTFL